MAKHHYGKKPRKSVSAGSHQANWLWGQQSVIDTLEADRWRVYELFVTQEVFEQYADLLQAKQKLGTELEIVLTARLDELSRTSEHQGIVARVSKYPYQTQDELGIQLRLVQEDTSTRKRLPLVVIVDRIQDAFNFGAILRCCENAGVCAVIIGEHCQTQVTPQIARSSSGAVNHIAIVKTDDLVSAAKFLQELGLKLVAVETDASQIVCDTPLNTPTALIIGSDNHSIEPQLLELCEQRVSVPMQGKIRSLPSSVVAGIMLYEIRRQQHSTSATLDVSNI